jgi:subtilase family serine protease
MRSKLLAVFACTLTALCLFTVAQRVTGQSGQARMITQPIDESKLMVQHGTVYPLARAEFDRGPVPASLPMGRILMVMKRSPAQQSAVESFLAQQLDKTSPNYHQWLSPIQFGERFGAAEEDIATVSSWLQSHGFQVAGASYGRGVIEFSGDAGQVEQAFHTSIHSYVVNGEQHFANATDPSFPAALMPAIEGVLSLHNFPRHSDARSLGAFRRAKNSSHAEPIDPQFTFAGGCGSVGGDCFALGPQDFATIYDVTPLYSAGIDGTGETIAVVADSNINVSDVTQFRSVFGLPANPPNVIIPPGSQDPGLGSDEVEAVLDTEWSGAVAKKATIDLVVSATIGATFGGDLSAEYIVNFNGNKGLAPILSESFGECELFLGTAQNAFYNSLWSQAAGEGITVIVSTGDSGSVACLLNPPDSSNPNPFGLGVSGVASTQFNIAVGGTDFNDITNPTTFWNTTNTAGTGGSAKGYIPETTWNDTCTNLDLGTDLGFSSNQETNCNNKTQLNNLITLSAGSGGPSNCTTPTGATNTSPGVCAGGNAKPSWQTVTGVPADGKRDLPDVSLFAATGAFSKSFYVICQADDPHNQNGQACSLTANNFTDFSGVGGTSVSTQVFAGLMALVDQAAKGPQGNFSPMMYGIAATQSCPTASVTANCVFHQVSVGTIAQACQNITGSLNCAATNKSDAFGVLTGFNAAPGFNLATGLGSVDATHLVNAAAGLNITPPAGSFTVGPASGTATVASPGGSATYQVTITGTGGFAGTVDFACSDPSVGVSCSGPSATLSTTATTATSTLTVTTTAATARLVPMGPGGGIAQHSAPLMAGISLRTLAPRLALVMILSAGLLSFAMKSRTRQSVAVCGVVILGMLIFAGCGGGGSSSSNSNGGGGGTGGTPTGNSTVTVSASSGGVTSSTTFTLTVK